MLFDHGEPVLVWEHLVRRVRRWRSGHPTHHACLHVTVGQLDDGRWSVESTGQGARAWLGEREAFAAAEELVAGGGWRPVPVMGRDGPLDGGWTRRGGEWFRDPPDGLVRPEPEAG